MPPKPSVTVVIPTYERNDLLRTSLESIAAQTYDGPVNVVVVDSHPEPVARPIVEEFDDATYYRQVEYFPRHETATHNSALARDVGVHHAEGEYVHFLDDDDELAPRAIQTKISALLQSERADGVYNAIKTSNGEVKSVPKSVPGHEIAYILQRLQSPAQPSTLLIKRKVLTKIQPQRQQTHTDIGTLLEILLRTRLIYLDKPLTVQNYAQGVGYTPAAQQARLQTVERYSGLRRVLLTPKQRKNSNKTYNNLKLLLKSQVHQD